MTMFSAVESTARLMSRAGLSSLLRRLDTWRGLLALNYHRIGRPDGSMFDHGVWSTTKEGFEEQLAFLSGHFDIIQPDELPGALRRRSVLITFDDGYRDNYEVAFPVLKRLGIRATFFVSTGFINHPRVAWWDEIAWMVRSSRRPRIRCPLCSSVVVFDQRGRENAISSLLESYKSLPPEATEPFMDELGRLTGTGRCTADARSTWMTWDMLREMSDAGMTIGGHTVNHPILSRLDTEAQDWEIRTCQRHIAQEIGRPMRFFSYPRGKHDAFNHVTRQSLRRNGVELAFSYYGGFRRLDDWDPYDVRRTSVEMDFSTQRFEAMLSLPQVFA